jgi:hypothetical protein
MMQPMRRGPIGLPVVVKLYSRTITHKTDGRWCST